MLLDSISSCRLHECDKDRRITALLGMPLNSDGEPTIRRFNRFHEAVTRASGHDEPGAETAWALMVVRWYDRMFANNVRELRSRLHDDVMFNESPRRIGTMTRMSNHVWDVLMEIAAEAHVDDLQAAAYPKHRHVAVKGASQKGEVGVVTLAMHAGGPLMGGRVIQTWIDVGAARENDSIERLEHDGR
jgi:hypothetical protein